MTFHLFRRTQNSSLGLASPLRWEPNDAEKIKFAPIGCLQLVKPRDRLGADPNFRHRQTIYTDDIKAVFNAFTSPGAIVYSLRKASRPRYCFRLTASCGYILKAGRPVENCLRRRIMDVARILAPVRFALYIDCLENRSRTFSNLAYLPYYRLSVNIHSTYKSGRQ
jgi:hypothetical protein